MFTGIIRLLGTVTDRRPVAGGGLRVVVRPEGPGFRPRPGVGDSIAVDGCCLTVAAEPGADGSLAFDLVPETLAKTTAEARLRPGARVHLEQAASASTLLDGHIVQGHVDGRAEVVSVVKGGEWRVRLRPPAGLMPYIVPKGSVAVAGVSLTIAEVSPGEGWFEVALIPTTLEKTNFRSLAAGEAVNIECDGVAKAVVHYLTHYAGTAPGLGRGGSSGR
jgi:riboflavin synthase